MTVESLIVLVCGLLVGGLRVWLVLHVPRRPKEVEHTRSPVASADRIPMPHPSPPDLSEDPAPSVTNADALILGDVENPLLEITPVDLSDRSRDTIDIDSSMLSTLQPLLQQVPEFFRLGQEMTTRTYRLVFSP